MSAPSPSVSLSAFQARGDPRDMKSPRTLSLQSYTWKKASFLFLVCTQNTIHGVVVTQQSQLQEGHGYMVIPRVLSLTPVFQLCCCWEEQLPLPSTFPKLFGTPCCHRVSQSSQRRNSTLLSTGLETISLLGEPGANPVRDLHIYPTSGQNFWENRMGLKHIRVIPTRHNQDVCILCLGIAFSVAI